MTRLFLLESATHADPQVARWFDEHAGALGALAKHWYGVVRSCGADVTETLHDGQPTACVQGAALAYVDVFTSHVNLGFFQGAYLPDPESLLTGTGKHMRHVKLRPDTPVDGAALTALIESAYRDLKQQLQSR
ncbi:MAG: hypothetical protein RLZZ385_351 [Pseudomonadota bacterium]|jgi:hypothetical protein